MVPFGLPIERCIRIFLADMTRSLLEYTDDLRNALLKLPPAGAAGFEGLLAVILTEISGVPFRLAASGSQFGLDGKATYESDGVCFEGKRYDGDIPRTEVLSKIAELSIRNKGDVDLWVLGATTEVRSQLADNVRELGERSGIATLVLDWSSTGLPPLAVALAMANTAVEQFLEQHVEEKDHVAKATAALKAVREDGGYAAHATRLRALLEEPTTGAGLAKQANIRWLTEVFSSRQQARRFLRQPLSPGDKAAGNPAPRDALVSRIAPLLTGKPDGKIAVILGDEGNGKSWIVAQSWLSVADKPVTIVFTADDFSESTAASELTAPLIDKIIAQTGGLVSEATRNRWRRRLEQWSKAGTPESPRLVVVVDGLNQRPRVDWARLIEAMASELDRIGGRLFVTARTAYYDSQVKRRLYTPTVRVNVPEWTDAERDAILAAQDIQGAGLQPAVATSLRNPRLLGIALELLHKAQIRELEELSISRLLFEHMRVHERDAPSPRPAKEFAGKLRDHAREVLSRVTAQRRDDLGVFDGDLEAVSDGRFFFALENDPTRYRLDEDGLTLALGFAVLDELHAARRNKRDLSDALEAMLEPVSALDRTADVVLAALTVACLDEDCPAEIGAAIAGVFTDLQNPSADHFPAFASLVGKRPEAFLQAAQRLCLASAHQPNFDWLETALYRAKDDEEVWAAMVPHVQAWLSCYSLSPETQMFSNRSRDPAEKVEKERTKAQAKITEAMAALSEPERKLLQTLTRSESGDLAALSRFALTLLAGKPLAPFVEALRGWCFANALNSSPWAPYKEFTHLVRLNRVDWSPTRDAILDACKIFDGADLSRTGKWALVNLLRATSHPDDARKVDALVEELTAGRPRFEGWRRVERYCSTDPCDPGSEKPENIAATATEYSAIDVTKIRLSMGSSGEDHFFAIARPGIARFEAQIGIDKHREFITDVLGRDDLPLRQGILETRRHNALVTREYAEQLVARAKAGTSGGDLKDNDQWLISQYHLLLAFPMLSAEEQVDALLLRDAGENILLNLMDVAKPLDEAKYETFLDKAVRDDDERQQFVLLAFGRSTRTPISAIARAHLAALAQSQAERVRAQALGLIAATGNPELISAVVNGGWTAANTRRDDGYEAWYGSRVILEAAVRGIIPQHEALDRIAPRLYGLAATKLDAEAVLDIARRVDASIKTAAGLSLDAAVLDIELREEARDSMEPTRYRASEKEAPSRDPMEALRRLSESNEAFEQRQKRIHAAFDAFKEELTQAKAQIILDRLRIQEFDAIAAADKELAESWFELFTGPPQGRRVVIHNLGLLLAHALSHWNPEKSVRLFRILGGNESVVRITFGRAGIPLQAIALWSAQDHTDLEALRFDRLDKAGSDDELAVEVLAAHWAGKQALLREYIEARIQTRHPAFIARALMIAGLSDRNEYSEEVLARYKDTPGFIGRAQTAATYAYERNIWSRHWFSEMRGTADLDHFWRYSVLIEKIIDGRLDIWDDGDMANGDLFPMLWPSIDSNVKNRIKKWQDQRKKKLFGDEAPPGAFLV
jgi:hypothetical protein